MHIIALDFDGVVCESARELGTSSWLASLRYTKLSAEVPETPPQEFLEYFEKRRPYLEYGYQGLQIAFEFQKITPCPDIPAEQLSTALASVRDKRFAASAEEWCTESPFYPGTTAKLKELLSREDTRPYIITKKRRRYTLALLAHNGIKFPNEYLHGLEDGAKERTLLTLAENNKDATKISFVEDRVETLERVAKVTALSNLELLFSTWGYHTEEQQARAQKHPRIRLISPQEFSSL